MWFGYGFVFADKQSANPFRRGLCSGLGSSNIKQARAEKAVWSVNCFGNLVLGQVRPSTSIKQRGQMGHVWADERAGQPGAWTGPQAGPWL